MTLAIDDFGFERGADGLALLRAADAPAFAGDPWWPLLPPADPLGAQLRPEHPFFAAGGAHRAFVALRGGDVVGRAVALAAPGLATEAGAPLGLLGFFRCADDPEAARALVGGVAAWLAARGCARLVGPLDQSTWYRYRVVTGGHARGPFLLDLHTPRHEADLLRAAGLEVVATYGTLRASTAPIGHLARAHARAVRAGITFEALGPEDVPRLLPDLFALCQRAFAGKTGYSAITWPEFQALYGPAAALVRPGLVELARGPDGAPLGLCFGYPDLLEPARVAAAGGAPGPVETTVVKTLGVAPDAPPGLGAALLHRHLEAARALGLRWALHALMEKWREFLRGLEAGKHRGDAPPPELWREYALFGRDLAAP